MKIDADLLDTIVTQEQANTFVHNLNNLSKELYVDEGSQSLRNKINKTLSEAESKIILESLTRNQILDTDPSQVEGLIQMFKEALGQAPTISLDLGVNLPMEYLITISKWFRINTARAVILDINVKPEILGGAILKIDGNRRDYSIKSKIDKYLEENTEINNILNNIN